MWKAFDTVDREILFEELEQTLQEDELHILSKITNTPEIKVRVGQTTGESFTSTICILQGDYANAIFFIYYLAHL